MGAPEPKPAALETEVQQLKHEVAALKLALNAERMRGASTALDIEKRNAHGIKIPQSAHEVEWLMKHMANAFVIWDTMFNSDGQLVDIRFNYFNDAYEKVSGLRLDEVRGKTVREVWPETEQSWFDVYGEVARTGIPRSFEMYHKPTRGLYACNAYRPREAPDRICVVFEDITERRQQEESLRSSERKLAEIFRSSPEFIVVSRAEDGLIIEVNDAFTRLLGFSQEEVLHHKSTDIGLWPTHGQRDQIIQMVIEQGEVRNLETCLQKKSGEFVDVLLSVAPIMIDGV